MEGEMTVWYDIEYNKLRMFKREDFRNEIAAGDEFMIRLGDL